MSPVHGISGLHQSRYASAAGTIHAVHTHTHTHTFVHFLEMYSTDRHLPSFAIESFVATHYRNANSFNIILDGKYCQGHKVPIMFSVEILTK